MSDRYEWSVSTYIVELYMERLSDLLEPPKTRAKKKLSIKRAKGSVQIPEARVVSSDSAEQLLEILARGMSDRQTQATAMNDLSSRSHLIMTVLIDITDKHSGRHTTGKLSFVDLAGCERVSKSKVGRE
jgi:hypothetical protein